LLFIGAGFKQTFDDLTGNWSASAFEYFCVSVKQVHMIICAYLINRFIWLLRA